MFYLYPPVGKLQVGIRNTKYPEGISNCRSAERVQVDYFVEGDIIQRTRDRASSDLSTPDANKFSLKMTYSAVINKCSVKSRIIYMNCSRLSTCYKVDN